MTRTMSGVVVVALVLGGLFGFLGSLQWDSRHTTLSDALEKTTRLEREVNALRAENGRIAAQLQAEQVRAHTMAGDLQREKDMNMRLHLIVSDGKK